MRDSAPIQAHTVIVYTQQSDTQAMHERHCRQRAKSFVNFTQVFLTIFKYFQSVVYTPLKHPSHRLSHTAWRQSDQQAWVLKRAMRRTVLSIFVNRSCVIMSWRTTAVRSEAGRGTVWKRLLLDCQSTCQKLRPVATHIAHRHVVINVFDRA